MCQISCLTCALVSLLSVGQMYADPAIPPEVSRWIFLASILVSFLLLGWDIFKAKRIIASRDISYTFTNIIASRYYSLKDYRYFCLFRRIQNSTKQVDSYAFFVFFTLKGKKHEIPYLLTFKMQSLTTLWFSYIQHCILERRMEAIIVDRGPASSDQHCDADRSCPKMGPDEGRHADTAQRGFGQEHPATDHDNHHGVLSGYLYHLVRFGVHSSVDVCALAVPHTG